MILVVADTGPVNYLLIGAIELLASLAEKTVLPAAVRAELLAERAPAAARAWATTLPAWAEVRTATRPIEADDISVADREAIALARELGASVLLMDDRQARRWAAKLGVSTIGTVGFLEAAAARELVSLRDALEKLRGTSCFLSDEVVERALLRDSERRRITGSGEADR